jgi:hypothetical protein
MLYALSAGGLLVAVDPQRMQVRWQQDLGSATELPPTYGASLIWTAVRDGWLRAFGPADGEKRFEVAMPSAPTSGVAVAYPYVLVGAASGELFAYRLPGLGGVSRSAVPDARQPRAGALQPQVRLTAGGRQGGAGPRMAALGGDEAGIASFFSAGPGGRTSMAATGAGRFGSRISGPGLRSLGGELCTQGRPQKDARGRSWLRADRLWLAGWIVGVGLALVLQEEGDNSFERYERTGDPARRAAAWDRAERYDHYALGAWAAGEVCFLMALYSWLSGD